METMRWNFKDAVYVLLINLIASFTIADLILKPGLRKIGLDSLIAGTLAGLFLALVALITVYFALRKYNLSWKAIGFNYSKGVSNNRKTIILYIFVLLVVAGVNLAFMYLIVDINPNSRSGDIKDPTLFRVLIAYASAVVVSPIYEEILYRGFLYQAFRNSIGKSMAIVLSAILFSLVHLPSYDILLINFINGILLALIYEKTKSIYSPIIVHGGFNGCLLTIVFITS